MAEPTMVTEGQVVSVIYADLAMSETVGPSCHGQGGYWYCVTHRQSFPTQIAKDSHIDKGEHELGWICPEHGIEVP